MTPWLIGIKYPNKITLCATKTIVLATVIDMAHSFYQSPKKLSIITNPKKSIWRIGKIFKFCGEKAIEGIVKF